MSFVNGKVQLLCFNYYYVMYLSTLIIFDTVPNFELKNLHVNCISLEIKINLSIISKPYRDVKIVTFQNATFEKTLFSPRRIVKILNCHKIWSVLAGRT